MPFYERGPVRIYYEEVGSGFPLLVIPGRTQFHPVISAAAVALQPYGKVQRRLPLYLR